MEKKVIDQKEYLKKYLASGDGEDKKKKKKRKMKVGTKTVKVIDDDIDLKSMRPMEENEFDIFIDAEDAPQIAGVVDERGPVDFSDKRRWKIIADDEGGDLTITSTNNENKQPKTNILNNNLSPPRKQKKDSDDNLSPPRVSRKKKEKPNEDSDLSPPRPKSKKHARSKRESSQSDDSSAPDVPSHKIKKKSKRKEKSDSDLNPPRHKKNDDSNLNPPRKSKKHRAKKSVRREEEHDSDLSPPRRARKDSDSDLSPPRKKKSKNYDSDLSPPRKTKNKNYDSDLSPPRRKKNKNYDSDLSPPRRHRTDVHSSSKQKEMNNDSDLSPPSENRKQTNSHFDAKQSRYPSPLRDHKHRSMAGPHKERNYKHSDKHFRSDRRHHDSDMSPHRKRTRDMEDSPCRNRDENDFYKFKRNKSNDRHKHSSKHSHKESSRRKERSEKSELKRNGPHDLDNEKRMKKTLDGKQAGLQDARALREETEAHKIREAEQFSKLSQEVTGVGQAAVMRDSKTGKRRNLEAEAAEEREKQKRQTELDEKYAKWGAGLKQVEDREEKLKDDLYEMSKPLARYADDPDLDRRLREQEREGDPMLEYIKQKQIKEGKRKPDRPKYEGSYMPNRFGIKPGHRWDGVDRSNGYEKRWFEAQNAKKAIQEEAYKWSTSDM